MSEATKVGIGTSKETEGFKAGAEAAKAAFKAGGLMTADFVMVASTIGFEQKDLLAGVKSVVGDAVLVGCSALGIITQVGPDETLRRVEVLAISSDKVKFIRAHATGLKKDSEKVGRDIAETLNKNWPENPKLLLLLADAMTCDPDALFRGLEGTLQEKLPFVGGTAGETLAFKHTYQYVDGEVLEDTAIGVLISGEFEFDIGVSHGSKPVGVVREVTKAEGNHIYELDGKPAYSIFREFLGAEADEDIVSAMVNVCLGVEIPKELRKDYEDVVLRIPLVHDKKDDSMYMAAEWPVGTKVFVCQRDPENIVKRAKEIAEKLKAKHQGQTPSLVLNFECAGRGKVHIGDENAKREIAANQEVFEKGVPWFGFYTFGEIAPIKDKNYFHNWTGVVCAIYL